MEPPLYSIYTSSYICTYGQSHIQTGIYAWILTKKHTNTYAQIYTPTQANVYIYTKTLVFTCHLHMQTHRNTWTYMLRVVSGNRLEIMINPKLSESQGGLIPLHPHPTQSPFKWAPTSDLSITSSCLMGAGWATTSNRIRRPGCWTLISPSGHC